MLNVSPSNGTDGTCQGIRLSVRRTQQYAQPCHGRTVNGSLDHYLKQDQKKLTVWRCAGRFSVHRFACIKGFEDTAAGMRQATRRSVLVVWRR